MSACELVVNALVAIAVFSLLRPAGSGAMSHGLYVSLVGALIGFARTITGTVSKLVSDAAGLAAYMRDYSRFFALPEGVAADSAGGVTAAPAPVSGVSVAPAPFGGVTAAPAPVSGVSVAPAPFGGVTAAPAPFGGVTAAPAPVGATPAVAAGFERLEIRDLRFRYAPDGEYVLNGVSLTMERGRTYSLIGQNGAGKSTLAKILLRLYRDFEGEILLNGVGIAEYSEGELRRIFSIVYQDFAKYYIPLRDNITLGRGQSGHAPGHAPGYASSHAPGHAPGCDPGHAPGHAPGLVSALRLAGLEDTAARLPQNEICVSRHFYKRR